MTDFTKLSPEDLARVTTRDGRRVEIISTKGREPFPVVGYVGNEPTTTSWRICGSIYEGAACPLDLIFPPALRVYYVNLYPDGTLSAWHDSPESARQHRRRHWLALYKITDDGVSATIEVIERNRGAE